MSGPDFPTLPPAPPAPAAPSYPQFTGSSVIGFTANSLLYSVSANTLNRTASTTTESQQTIGGANTIIPLVSQRALARVSLDLELAEEFERRHAEIYPCAFTGQDEPWVEARGLFPFAGITEDPATGSAAGPLAAYMAREGVLPPEEERVVLQGAQIGRPSFLTVAVSGTAGAITGVRVGGSVQPVLKGELFLPE